MCDYAGDLDIPQKPKPLNPTTKEHKKLFKQLDKAIKTIRKLNKCDDDYNMRRLKQIQQAIKHDILYPPYSTRLYSAEGELITPLPSKLWKE